MRTAKCASRTPRTTPATRTPICLPVASPGRPARTGASSPISTPSSPTPSPRHGAFQDTDYAEASIGYAYRPVDNDRLNALFRYTLLYDMPGNNQLVSGSTGDLFAPAQRSHILSLDVDYDLFPGSPSAPNMASATAR